MNPTSSESTDTRYTLVLMGMFGILALLFYGVFLYDDGTTETRVVTTIVTLKPGDAVPETNGSLYYAGPATADGSILRFETGVDGEAKNQTYPFKHGATLPKVERTKTSDVRYDSYADGNLRVAHTEVKRVPIDPDDDAQVTP